MVEIERAFITEPQSQLKEDGKQHGCSTSTSNDSLNATSVTAVNVLNAILGTAVISLPYAIKQGGVVMLFLIVPLACIMGYTMCIIGKSLAVIDPKAEQQGISLENRDWLFLGFEAFGAKGKQIVCFFLMADLYGILLTYIVTAATGIHLVAQHISLTHTVYLLGLLLFILLFVPLRCFAVFSFLGIVLQILVAVGLLVSGIELEVVGSAAHEFIFFNPSGALAAFGVVVFAFNAHCCTPMMYHSMRHKHAWPKAVALGTSAACVFMIFIGGLGYLFYGSSTHQAIISNFGLDLDDAVLSGPLPKVINGPMGPLSGIFFALKLVVTFPVFCKPLLTILEESLKVQGSRVCGMAFRFGFMAATSLIAVLFRKKLALLTELVGCVAHVWTTIILPCACCLRLAGGTLGLPTKLFLSILVVVSIIYMVVGTLDIVGEMMESA